MLTELAIELHRRLDEYGLRIHASAPLDELAPGLPVPGWIERAGGGGVEVLLVYMDKMTMTTLSAISDDGGPQLLVLGPRIHERSAETLREAGISFVDSIGNAHVEFENVLIDVRGKRPTDVHAIDSLSFPAHGTSNLFSVKRSQVIFALLQWPELSEGPLRDLAEAAGVSMGLVQTTLEMLAQAGYVGSTRDRRVRRGRELLDAWTAAYRTGLGAAQRWGAYYAESLNIEPPAGQQIYVSGEAAVPMLVRPETVTLYTSSPPTRMAGINRWRRDREPNVFVRKQFWREPEWQRADAPVSAAPAILIYADLRASGDARQREIADQFRSESAELQRL